MTPRWSRPLAALAGTLALAGLAAAADPAAVARTPLGADAAGNAEGTIPAWNADTAGVDDSADAPLARIGRDRAADPAVPLCDGQRALLQALPDRFELPVYASRRRATAPPAFIAGTARNATAAFLDPATGLPQSALAGIPFPVLSQRADEAGLQAIWNHRLRWRGADRSRVVTQSTASNRGERAQLRIAERQRFTTLATLGRAGVLTDSVRLVLAPDRLAGTLKLVRERLQGAPLAWQRSPHQPLFQGNAPAGDDTAVVGAEGLFDEDQAEGYAGPVDRYDWKWLGRRERLVPYDGDRIDGSPAEALFGPRHVLPERLRYELHRVHVVEARVRPGLSVAFPRRTFYLDEDSWQVLMVELYDRSGRLVRLQEVHTRVGPDGALLPVLETVYDLPGQRYLAVAAVQGDGPTAYAPLDAAAFDPERVLGWSRKFAAAP